MDKFPTGAPPGGGVDGAFERFITAAIATIITIMFSWRLLSEEEEARGQTQGLTPPPPRAAMSLPVTLPGPRVNVNTERPRVSALEMSQVSHTELEVNSGECIAHETVTSFQCEPQTTHDLEAIPPAVDINTASHVTSVEGGNVEEETLSTWDDLNWGEDSDGEEVGAVHTRRSVRDFITQNTGHTPNNDDQAISNPESNLIESPASANSDMSPMSFTDRFANFEYRDTGGDSGYIDLYPDVESDDDGGSSDDEQHYDLQVSSSDSSCDGSDEEDDSGSFFGVTQLDTIMEEIESESSESESPSRRHSESQKSCDSNDDNVHVDTLENVNEMECITSTSNNELRVGRDIIDNDLTPGDNKCDTRTQTCDTRVIDSRCEDGNCHMLDMSDTNRYTIETNTRCDVEVSKREYADSQQPHALNTGSKRETVVHNLPHDSTSIADENITSDINFIYPQVATRDTECNISRLNTLNPANTSDNMSSTQTRTDGNSADGNLNKPQAPDIKSAFAIELSKLQFKMRPHNLSEKETDLKTSDQSELHIDSTSPDQSDDSLPSSPVRTRALDHLADELHSDTESCSSESVITVLSVRSNDSDQHRSYEVNEPLTPPALPLLTGSTVAGGDTYIDSHRDSDGDVPVGQSSLVSSFLNDSLNSLNTAHRYTNNNTQTMDEYHDDPGLDQIREIDSSCCQMNGRLSNDSLYEAPSTESSSTDSLTTGENIGSQTDTSINIINGLDGEEPPTELTETPEFVNESDYLGRFIGSDSSSDSSDPPLREYDPDEDDLAEFQFHDGDEDSFYLVVGDEGNLRNFETFTNLNSIGLSPEYGDAVTSSTVNENVTGFKFSKTEEISTKFRRRTYLTDRCNTPDSETRSDGMLSPISSEDEGHAHDTQTVTETNQPVSNIPEINIDNITLPLEKSVLTNEPNFNSADLETAKGNIDFQKYIIQHENQPHSGRIQSNDDQVLANSMSVGPNTMNDSVLIDEGRSDNINAHSSSRDIDLSNKQNVLSVNDINNSECQGETLASLTNKIHHLLQTAASTSEQDSVLGADNIVDTCHDEAYTAGQVNILHTITSDNINTYSDKVDLPGDTDLHNTDCDTPNDFHSINNSCSSTCDTDTYVIPGVKVENSTDIEINNNDALIDPVTCDYSVSPIPENSSLDVSGTVNNVHKSIETNIDDLLTEVSNICDKSVKQSNESENKEHKINTSDPISKKETNIDDIFAENVLYLRSSTKRKTKKKSLGVDDVVGDNQSIQSNSDVSIEWLNESPYAARRKLETNVDDLFIDDIVPAASVDDDPLLTTIVDENSNESEIALDPRTGRVKKVKGPKRKSGGSVGRLFGERDKKAGRTRSRSSDSDTLNDITPETINIPVYITPIQSTPCKYVTDAHDQSVGSKKSQKERTPIETCVDDLFNDLEAGSRDILTSSDLPDKNSSSVKSLENNTLDSLTYETFVDDLFEDILSKDSCPLANTHTDNVTANDCAILDHSGEHSITEISDQSSPDLCTVCDKGTNSNTQLPNLPVLKQSDSCQIEQNGQNANTIEISDPVVNNNENLCALSGDYKTISGDVSSDKPPITASIDTSQYRETFFDNERIDSRPIVSTIQTNTHEYKGTFKTDILSRCDQNNADNNNTHEVCLDGIVHSKTNNSSEIDPITQFEIESEKLIAAPVAHSIPITELSNVNDHSETIVKRHTPDYNGSVRVTEGRNPNINYVGQEPVELNNSGSSKLDNIHNYEVQNTDALQSETEYENIELKIVEDDENLESLKSDSGKWDSLDYTSSAYDDSSEISFDGSLNSIDDSYSDLQNKISTRRQRVLSESAIGRIVREHVTKPSEYVKTPGSSSRDLQGVRRRIHKQQLKKYTSILQQPVISEGLSANISLPEQSTPLSRLLINKSRQRFLSAENLSCSFDDRFSHYRMSLGSTPRKYLKRHEKHLAERQSTESLPADMSSINMSIGTYSSMDRLHGTPYFRRVGDVNLSRNSSANTSYERPAIDKLHPNCIFTPRKQKELEEIRHSTKSLENMFEQLLKYGSVSSLVETDLDAGDACETGYVSGDHTDIGDFVSLQYPLERAASMSALTATSDGHHLPRKPGKGRFAGRHVAKSKSLQTLETNLDDVFADEDEFAGELKKAPSVHELRVAKSLSKLSVPDWFKKSSFSRSDSTQSLFTYAGRQGSTSTVGSSIYPCSITTSPSPSVTPGSHAVIIQKRVTPSPTSPSARLVRAPMLPVTPERAPIHPTPSEIKHLPSDKYRSREKKSLKPIAIVSFAKLREMFERKSTQSKTASRAASSAGKKLVRSLSTEQGPPVSPTKEKPTKVRFESMPPTRADAHARFPEPISPTRETLIDMTPPQYAQSQGPRSPNRETLIDAPSPREMAQTRLNEPRSPIKETIIDEPYQPVQNRRNIVSPPPPIPERKRIIVERSRSEPEYTQQNGQPRKTQVHFSDETTVSKSQEQNAKSVKASKKSQSLRSSLPMPQFRFRRPGSMLKAQSQATQNKKGKIDTNLHDASQGGEPFSGSLHALEIRAQSDGEHLFEFLQKRRYSSLLENGFAEQMDDLQDKDVTFTFPIMSVGKHSTSGYPVDRSSDMQVVLANACLNHLTNGGRDNGETPSLEDVLEGLLAMKEHSALDGGRRMAKLSDDDPSSPESVHGLNIEPPGRGDTVFIDTNGREVDGYDVEADYVLVRCTNDNCKRETNLKEAKKFYKTCHNCYTYYCSRTCRKEDWETHKIMCIYSRINSACKHAIKAINRSPQLQYHCSRLARRGYLSQGRGCVVLAFPDISSSEDFLYYGMDSLWVPPVYVSVKELPYADMFGTKLDLLVQTCKQYNPELKYVIHVAVVIPPKLPTHPIPRKNEPIIQKCAKLRLSPAHMHPKQEEADVPSTMILTAVPRNSLTEEVEDLKARELCFINIQRKLRHRGVSLRHQFPEVYNKLIDFVSDAKHFSPLIIYPVDSRTGRKFMCVIMPESEPEIEWIRDPDLFQELDVFDEDECQLSIMSTSLPDLRTALPDFPEDIML